MNSGKRDYGAKVLAALLIVGGILGVGIGIYLGYVFLQQHWVYIILLAALEALFIWTVVVGVRLWRNYPRGWKWAKILYAAQIPVLTVPGLRYEYYTGISVKVFGPGTQSHFQVGLGANASFYLDTAITDVLYGVNLFALAALVYLLVRSRSNAQTGFDADA